MWVGLPEWQNKIFWNGTFLEKQWKKQSKLSELTFSELESNQMFTITRVFITDKTNIKQTA